MSSEAPAKSTDGSRLGLVASVVAAALVVVYLVFVSLMWQDTKSDALNWSRRAELLSGLEALAFTAAGTLLGTTVQRQVTKSAESRAEQAEAAAERDARDAEKGRALHRAITARSATGATARSGPVTRGVGTPTSESDPLAELAELARSYDE